MWMIQVFQGLLTPVIAGIAVYIARQQWQANRLKLVLDRFNRRWVVYQAVLDFIVAVCLDFKISADEIGKFRRATIQAEFLFGPEIPQYIDELCDRSIKLADVQSQYRDLSQAIPPGYDHKKVVDAMSEGERWFANLLDLRTVNQKFKKYLDISG